MSSDTPTVVPPDKAPLQSGLQATLATLQEAYSKLWTSLRTGYQRQPTTQHLAIISGLIVTAVQQAEALPQREGDLAAWREKAREIMHSIAKAIGTGRGSMTGNLFAKLDDHLAAMPAQPDPNEGLLKALRKRHVHSLSWPCGIECDAAAAIAAAERRTAG